MTLQVAEFQQTGTYTMQSFRDAYRVAGGLQIGTTTAWPVTVSGMTLTIGAGSAVINASGLGGLGYYHVENDAAVTLTVSAANGTFPRIDTLVLTVQDASLGGASNTATLSLLAGTPTSGATLANQLGAASVPAATVRLAHILVPAGAASLTTAANIRLKNAFSRGAALQRTSVADITMNNPYSTTLPTPSRTTTLIPNEPLVRVTNLQGFPLRILYTGLETLMTFGQGVSPPLGIIVVPMYSTDATSGTSGTGTWAAMDGRFGFLMEHQAISRNEAFCYDVTWVPPGGTTDVLIGLGLYGWGAPGTTPFSEGKLLGATPGEGAQITVEEITQSPQTLRNN